MFTFHHNDLDGRCAAAIVHKKFPICKFEEMEYSKIPDFSNIEKNEKIFIVDFSFKPETMNELLKITKNIIWIDHHKTAFEYEKKYSHSIESFLGTKDSGCELTWKYFYHDDEMPECVRLIGDFDKWAWKFGERTSFFKEGIRCYKHSPTSAIWEELFNDDGSYIEKIIKEGKICLQYRDTINNDYCEQYGFETEFEGHKAFACGFYNFGSEKFGKRIEKYPILLSFEFNGEKYLIGLYSNQIDVSSIAKKYEGGGHKGAAGFTSDKIPFKKISKRRNNE